MSVARGIYNVIRRNTATRVYCVPGESYLALLNEFASTDGPTLVSTRHEEGAGLMAEAHAKLTGEVGTVLVTRGPGLTHLSIALHTALQDSTPLVAFVGQVPTTVKHRESFQEVDIVNMTMPIAKWSVEITDASRAVELVEEAYRVAAAGRPGPVVVSLPEDIDREAAKPTDSWRKNRVVGSVGRMVPNDETIGALRRAASPSIIVGRPVSGQPLLREAIERLAMQLDAPVYNAWRRFDAFDNSHEHFAGNIPILSAYSAELLKESDVVLLIDDRLDEFTSLYYSIPSDSQHVLVVGGAGAVGQTADDLTKYIAELGETLGAYPRDRSSSHRARAVDSHRAYTNIDNLDLVQFEPDHPLVLSTSLAKSLPADAILTSDAGTFASWVYRTCSLSGSMRFLGPTAGGMGYAIPSAIAARLAEPTRPVYAIAGDGGFAMTMSELETARRLELGGIGVIVFDNEIYGTIAAHQDKHFPGRRVGVDLGPIDYSALAASFDWTFRMVDSAESMSAAIAAVDRGERVLIHAPIPKEELGPLSLEWPQVKVVSEFTSTTSEGAVAK